MGNININVFKLILGIVVIVAALVLALMNTMSWVVALMFAVTVVVALL